MSQLETNSIITIKLNVAHSDFSLIRYIGITSATCQVNSPGSDGQLLAAAIDKLKSVNSFQY